MTASDDNESYCTALVREHDRDRYLTAVFAPAERRRDLMALYAFNLEVARVREVVTEPMLGRIRLQWWRETLDGLYAGKPRHHQVADALYGAIARRHLSRRHFDTIIDAREADLDEQPPATIGDLKRYAEGTSSSLVSLALEVLGEGHGAGHLAGRHVGLAWALVGVLRALPFHVASGRILIPGDVQRQYDLDLGSVHRGESPEGLKQAVRSVAEIAAEHLRHARGQKRVPAAALPALLPAVLADLHLRDLAGVGYDPFALGRRRPRATLPVRLWWQYRRGRF